MEGWTEVQQEEGVSWITVFSYGDQEIEGHLKLLPGDAVIPQMQNEVVTSHIRGNFNQS